MGNSVGNKSKLMSILNSENYVIKR
jgi:hypothetical protein